MHLQKTANLPIVSLAEPLETGERKMKSLVSSCGIDLDLQTYVASLFQNPYSILGIEAYRRYEALISVARLLLHAGP